ncbi:unnamed protein product [Schistosoma curassoni]|uniref:MIP-T3 domain-containing protein n=1 Tax=Schistosoma curassoni TaxID=6186 RepID=A0A183K8V6_9TREM|nr:unnamed protein product [Schistosoma curassoni]
MSASLLNTKTPVDRDNGLDRVPTVSKLLTDTVIFPFTVLAEKLLLGRKKRSIRT